MSNGPLSHFDKLVGILKQEVLFMCRAIIYFNSSSTTIYLSLYFHDYPIFNIFVIRVT